MTEYGDKLQPEEKGNINDAVEQLKKGQDGNDIAAMKESIENLNKVWTEISTKMYERVKTETPPPNKEQQPGAETQESSATGKEDNVEDADFEVVDDK